MLKNKNKNKNKNEMVTIDCCGGNCLTRDITFSGTLSSNAFDDINLHYSFYMYATREL